MSFRYQTARNRGSFLRDFHKINHPAIGGHDYLPDFETTTLGARPEATPVRVAAPSLVQWGLPEEGESGGLQTSCDNFSVSFLGEQIMWHIDIWMLILHEVITFEYHIFNMEKSWCLNRPEWKKLEIQHLLMLMLCISYKHDPKGSRGHLQFIRTCEHVWVWFFQLTTPPNPPTKSTNMVYSLHHSKESAKKVIPYHS